MGILTVNTDFEKLFGITEREYYAKQYLTYEMLEDQGASIEWFNGFIEPDNPNLITKISFSVDEGNTWTDVTIDDNEGYELGMFKKGQKILFKGNGGTYNHSSKTYLYIMPEKNFTVYGNIMSLIYGDDFYGKNFDTNKLHSFGYLFAGISTILDAHNLILPTNTVKRCYMHMFEGCYTITTAPELLSTNTAQQAYESMFNSCSKLAYVASRAQGNSNGTTNWLKDVAATGTFVCDFYAKWNNGVSGIPTGWTKIVYDLPTPTETVEFTPNAGGVLDGTEVHLWFSRIATGIKFTTDGSNPTAESQTYHNADIVINEATTVKAAVFNADDVDFKLGPISSAEYTIITPSLTIYVDKFPTAEQIEEYELEDIYTNAGMTRDEYMTAEAATPENYDADKYVYYGESVKIDATTYYIWKIVAGGSDLFLLTTTADCDTLSTQSIAEEGDVPFTSMFALATSEDGEFDVYEENAESAIPRQLLKIEQYLN